MRLGKKNYQIGGLTRGLGGTLSDGLTFFTVSDDNPSLILTDEPMAALDGEFGHKVMELFAKIAHERKAGVIVVTHDHRTLEVFDPILDVGDGMIKIRA